MKEVDRMFDDLNIEGTIKNPKKVTHVAIIIDQSGSMFRLRDFVVDTFNEQIKTFKEETDSSLETRLSVITFADEIKFVRWDEDIHDVNPLDNREYVPSGNTALMDAIGFTCARLKELPDADNKDTSFLLMIITDGQENKSKEWNYDKIKILTEELQKTERWTVTYYGTEPDQISKDMHVYLANTMSFSEQDMLSGKFKNELRSATANYMSERKLGASYSSSFYDDKTTAQSPETKDWLNQMENQLNVIAGPMKKTKKEKKQK
jgi:uncharacterized protein YegL